MKKNCARLILLAMLALMVLPVSVSSQNMTNSTTVPTTVETIVNSSTTSSVPIITTTTEPVNTTVTLLPTTTASSPVTTTEKVLNITTITIVPTPPPVTQVTTGTISVASSPFGASVLIDGIYYGNTPREITDITGGNHIIRLTMSGYYDYEGTVYVVPGQIAHAFGTLHPVSGYFTQTPVIPATTVPTQSPLPVTTVEPVPTTSPGMLENPTVIAAIIGIITATIGAAATIFPHLSKTKKDEKP